MGLAPHRWVFDNRGRDLQRAQTEVHDAPPLIDQGAGGDPPQPHRSIMFSGKVGHRSGSRATNPS